MISVKGERKTPVELSRMSDTSANPTGPRFAVPLKMTSSIFAPRSEREDCSPSTQRIASEIFDLPEPFGPTIAVMPPRNLISVRSGNDLNPCKIRLLRTMCHLKDIDKIFYHFRFNTVNQNVSVQIHRNVDIRMSHDILQAFRVNMFFKPNFRYRGLITSKL